MDCYGIRRVSPYLGVIQVIDVGDARAYSTDGLRWRFRALADEDRLSGVLPGDGMPLSRAVRERPLLPFPMGDRFELWLLSKATGRPLALLRTGFP